MSSLTYPVARPEGDLTAEQIQLLLANPRLIARRIQQLTDQRFLADYLLTGRFNAVGGGIFYENGDELFVAENPEQIAPGAEYPLSVVGRGDLAAAKTVKWGRDSEVYDEAIARLGINPVDRALTKLANTIIRYIDTVAWGVISSKVTGTLAAGATWTDAGKIITSVLTARAAEQDLELGIERDTVILTTTQYAKVLGIFMNSGLLPREEGNVILSGNLPTEIMGFTWVTSTHISGSDPLLVDRDQLGGMADEDLRSPGYVRNRGVGIETLSERIG
ncbi:MAG TPA: hypothetical protein VIL55_16810, partial [Naasia sp.]